MIFFHYNDPFYILKAASPGFLCLFICPSHLLASTVSREKGERQQMMTMSSRSGRFPMKWVISRRVSSHQVAPTKLADSGHSSGWIGGRNQLPLTSPLSFIPHFHPPIPATQTQTNHSAQVERDIPHPCRSTFNKVQPQWK